LRASVTVEGGDKVERQRLHDIGRRALEVESNSVFVATVALIVFIGIVHPDFLAWGHLKDVVQNAAYVGIIAAGMAFLISMREIDLSVGSMFGLSLVTSALFMQHGMNPWLGALLGILLGCAMGLFNAILVQFVAIPAIVATLATLSMYRGLAQALSDGEQVTGLPAEHGFFTFFGGDFAGLPVSVWVLIIVAIVLTAVLRFTPYGYRVRAIGSNPEAATFSGISIPRVRVQTLVLVGALSGLSGMLGLAFFISGDPNIGTGFELQAIAAVVIGGTPLRGGSATVVGAVLGSILLSAVNSGLAYFDVPVNWSNFATGAVILAAVALDSLIRGRRRHRRTGLDLCQGRGARADPLDRRGRRAGADLLDRHRRARRAVRPRRRLPSGPCLRRVGRRGAEDPLGARGHEQRLIRGRTSRPARRRPRAAAASYGRRASRAPRRGAPAARRGP
jgi:ribose transport system permease protein